MKNFSISDLFVTKEQVLSVLPFCFNKDNSDITIIPFIDGLVTVSVTFGIGKGWDSISRNLAEATEISYQWGNYTLGLEG